MSIKIYIANLGKYNEGELVGKWVTLPISEEELNEVFVEIGLGYFDENGNYVHGLEYVHEGEVDGVVYEEWAIHDYEAPFKIEEYTSIEKLNEIAEMMEGMDEEDIEVASALLRHGIVNDFEEALEEVENGNVTVWHEESMADIALAWHTEVTGQIDEEHPLFNYIDWERVGEDMEINGTFIEVRRGLWVEYHN